MQESLTAQPPSLHGSKANRAKSRRSRRFLIWVLIDAVLAVVAVVLWSAIDRNLSPEAKERRDKAFAQRFLGSHLPTGSTHPRMTLLLPDHSSLEVFPPSMGRTISFDKTFERSILTQLNLAIQFHGATLASFTNGWRHVGNYYVKPDASDTETNLRLYTTPRGAFGIEHDGAFYETAPINAEATIKTMLEDAQAILSGAPKPPTSP